MIEGLIALGVLLLMIALGVPLIVSLAGTVALYIVIAGFWPLSYPQQIIAGMDGFILLAMPLFILAGTLMNNSGISTRIFEFARAIAAPMRGSTAQVNVLTSVFFGGMIGTSVADLAGTGSVMIPEMKRKGYRPEFSAALTASASGIGPLLPPSSPMILYSAVTGVSLGTLFLAGIIPGLLLAATMMLIVWFLARKHGWESGHGVRWLEVVRTFRRASLAFGLPLLIVGGLVFGLFTPTEAGAFAVVYALAIAVIAYRSLSWKRFYQAMVTATTLTGEVMLIVGASVALGATLSRARVPEALADGINLITPPGQVSVLIALVLLALIAGMLIDPLIPVLVPIVLPTLVFFEIDLVHFGVLMVMTVVIGQVTPPVAMSLVVGGKIGRVDPWKVFKANTPFLIGMVVLLAVLIFFPALSTWLPELLS